MEASERSFVKIETSDLERLALLSKKDAESFFSRHPYWQRLYADRTLCVALCQGAALHYIDGKNGVKDFDVWTFYAAHPDVPFPWRRRKKVDFGLAKFGTNPEHIEYIGRRVEFLARSLQVTMDADPVSLIRAYLCDGFTDSARLLSRKAVILISPENFMGKIVWPK